MDVDIKDGTAFIKGSPENQLSFSDAVIVCQQTFRGKPVIGEGFYNPEEDGKLDIKALVEEGVGNYSPAYSFGAHITEVDVDEQTGEVHVKNVVVAHDCGVAINPMAVEGQLEGSVAMGHGFALMETVTSDDGMMLNPNFLEYKLPLSVDLCPADIHLIETHDPKAPFGAKEAGEGPVSPVAPSIVNAVHHATGVWIKELPITPREIAQSHTVKDQRGIELPHFFPFCGSSNKRVQPYTTGIRYIFTLVT